MLSTKHLMSESKVQECMDRIRELEQRLRWSEWQQRQMEGMIQSATAAMVSPGPSSGASSAPISPPSSGPPAAHFHHAEMDEMKMHMMNNKSAFSYRDSAQHLGYFSQSSLYWTVVVMLCVVIMGLVVYIRGAKPVKE